MTAEKWHVGPELLARYASGGLDLVVQSDVEVHVARCQDCREIAIAMAPQPVLDEVWQGVVSGTAERRAPMILRLAARLGLPETDVVILRASGALHRPWVLSVSGAFVLAVLGSMLGAGDQRGFYLLMAPLLPALTVAAAYDATDPIRDLGSSTPFSKLRIALLRTALAVSVALPLVLAVGLILSFVGGEAFGWLLPALTLTLITLILLTWWSAPVSAGAVGGAWLTVVAALRAGDHLASAATPAAQLAFATATLLALILLGIRLTMYRAPGGYA
ncbi:MAG: hypothetical protein ACXWXI_04975 [Aeromicrobium sp.]